MLIFARLLRLRPLRHYLLTILSCKARSQAMPGDIKSQPRTANIERPIMKYISTSCDISQMSNAYLLTWPPGFPAVLHDSKGPLSLPLTTHTAVPYPPARYTTSSGITRLPWTSSRRHLCRCRRCSSDIPSGYLPLAPPPWPMGPHAAG